MQPNRSALEALIHLERLDRAERGVRALGEGFADRPLVEALDRAAEEFADLASITRSYRAAGL
jgi:hypothetical protein